MRLVLVICLEPVENRLGISSTELRLAGRSEVRGEQLLLV